MQSEIFKAILKDNLTLVRFLIEVEKKIDVNSMVVDGCTILYIACHLGHLNITDFLIEKGADVNTANSDGVMPLHIACKLGHIEVAKLLIEKGARVNVTDNSKLTPFHWVEDRELAKLLMERKANINATNINGITPLHLACENGRIEIVSLLITDPNAQVNVADIVGLTPLHIACIEGYVEIAKLLISHILFKNSKEKKPNFINEYHNLSTYWDEQIEKINYLSQEKVIGSESLTRTILNKVISRRNDSLIYLSFHQFFKLLHPKIIKNSAANEASQYETKSPRLIS